MKRNYEDKIFVTNTHSAVAHVTNPVQIPTETKKESDTSSEWYDTFIKVRRCLDREYLAVCKNYDIDQDNKMYDKLEDVARSITNSIYNRVSSKAKR